MLLTLKQKYYREHKEDMKEYSRQYYQEHKSQRLEYSKQHYLNHKEEYLSRAKGQVRRKHYDRDRCHRDLRYRTLKNLRSRIWKAFKGECRSDSIMELLGSPWTT